VRRPGIGRSKSTDALVYTMTVGLKDMRNTTEQGAVSACK